MPPLRPSEYTLVSYSVDHEVLVRSSRRGIRHDRARLERCMRRPDVVCLVAVSPSDHTSILGWAAVQDGALLYVYTRRLFGKLRQRGLGTVMLAALGIDVSQPFPCRFWSPSMTAVALHGAWRAVYAP